jgi:FKBP-type peptidyl-prolyl cis-trans isomerase
VDQNLFQRFISRVSEFFSSLFARSTGTPSSVESSAHADPTAHTASDQPHHHSLDAGAMQGAQGTNAEPSLASLDLSLFHKIDTLIGHGSEAFPGADVTVHYTGWLIDQNAHDLKGQKFDSSVDRGQKFNFPLGQGHVIRGWDEGFAGMKIGGKRTLLIPPEMGYGARGAGGVIPPNATLMFEVELFEVN